MMGTLAAAAALLPLGITAINLLTWRPVRAMAPVPRASALVPARDEAQNISACVEALLAEPFSEVIVLDDGSTDATPDLLAAIAAREPRLRVIHGRPLAPGWVGKPHACDQLAAAATGDVLVFVDADVTFCPGGLARLAARLAGGKGAGVVSALPAQRTGSAFEALIIAQLHLVYGSWLPLALVRLLSSPRVLAANGQILAFSREAYARSGGFAGVRAEVVDDMALCRNAKRAGVTVDFVDGANIGSCRMYRTDRAAWEGFSKNLYEGIGGNLPALALVVALHVACFWAAWVVAPLAPVAWLGVAANLAQRLLLARRFGHPMWTVLAHPVGVGLLIAVTINSWRWAQAGRIRWRGRAYAARDAREVLS